MAGQYEFSEKENETIGAVARRLIYLSIVTMGWGCLLSAGPIYHGEFLAGIMRILLTVAMVACMWAASRALFQVVKTEGSDIDHLMNAMNQLDRLGVIIITLMTVVLVFACVVLGYVYSLKG